MPPQEHEEWVTVGGKNRPRRTPAQQQRHLEERAAAASALLAASTSPRQAQHLLSLYPACRAQQQAQQQQAQQAQLEPGGAGAVPPAPAQSTALPGWGPPPEREWKVAASSKSKRRAKQGWQAPSCPEEEAAQLQQQVHGLAQDLQQTPMFAALVAAMSALGDAVASATAQAQAQAQQEMQAQQQEVRQQAQTQQQRPSWDWSRVQQLVVYGLGSAESSRVSRHQLALVLLLQRTLPGLATAPQLFDPAFSEVDRLLLQRLGLALIPTNEDGRRRVDAHTLFYLPHCEGVLCDNLLAANWSADQLGRMALLGNSFATYAERWSAPSSGRPSTRRPDKLLALVEHGAVCEVAVPDHGFHVASAFNDMSLHTFTPRAAAAAGLFEALSQEPG